jgi:hypothetical protein
MINKASLMALISRAETGSLLRGEAMILRDAVELLDDLSMMIKELGIDLPGSFDPSTTQTFKVISDDDQRGRP